MTAIYFMYADSCYFISMLAAVILCMLRAVILLMLTAVQEQRSRLFYVYFIYAESRT